MLGSVLSEVGSDGMARRRNSCSPAATHAASCETCGSRAADVCSWRTQSLIRSLEAPTATVSAWLYDGIVSWPNVQAGIIRPAAAQLSALLEGLD